MNFFKTSCIAAATFVTGVTASAQSNYGGRPLTLEDLLDNPQRQHVYRAYSAYDSAYLTQKTAFGKIPVLLTDMMSFNTELRIQRGKNNVDKNIRYLGIVEIFGNNLLEDDTIQMNPVEPVQRNMLSLMMINDKGDTARIFQRSDREKNLYTLEYHFTAKDYTQSTQSYIFDERSEFSDYRLDVMRLLNKQNYKDAFEKIKIEALTPRPQPVLHPPVPDDKKKDMRRFYT